MAEIYTQLTAADQTLAFGLTWFATATHADVADRVMMAGVIEDVLGSVTQDHPVVMPMMDVARAIIRMVGEGKPGLSMVHYDVSGVIANFARWRTGRSFDAFRAQQQENAA